MENPENYHAGKVCSKLTIVAQSERWRERVKCRSRFTSFRLKLESEIRDRGLFLFIMSVFLSIFCHVIVICYKSLLQLCHDRGYLVTQDELDQTLDQFKEIYGDKPR